ncbi:MAG: efflux RND transporter periplasmic adaptor subunit [bacterium]
MLEGQQKVPDDVTIFAPQGGVVVERARVEGTWVETGTRLYRIAELDWVWIEASAYERDLPWLRFGQPVAFELEAARPHLRGSVAFIEPFMDAQTRAARVCSITVPNPDGLLAGMFARVTVESRLHGEGHDGARPRGAPHLSDASL